MKDVRIAGNVMEMEAADRFYNDGHLLAFAKEKLAAGDWSGCIWIYPRPLRLQLFIELMPRLTDAEYWDLLRQVWIDSEGAGYNRSIWLMLFSSDRPQRHNIMIPEEHQRLAGLQDPLTLYRGAEPKHARGMSWTLDIDQAAWFAWRRGELLHRESVVYTTLVPKRKLLAYFCERQEAEAVIDPRRIRLTPCRAPKGAVERIEARQQRELEEIRKSFRGVH